MSAPSSPAAPQKVWTTLITNIDFIPGLLVLDFSLKRAQSRYPLVALYTDSLSAEGHAALDVRGILKHRIDYVIPLVQKDYSNDERFYHCWSKLQPFGLTQYERIVQLDSDMLVRKNMDELMDLDLGENAFGASHACVCNPLKKKHYPTDWTPSNCAFTSQHPNPDAAQLEGASCTFGLGTCNGGLLITNPDASRYGKICAALADPDKTGSYNFADQSLLSDIFEGKWLAISYKYNALKTLRWSHSEIWRDEEVKNVHYILVPKPWDEVKGSSEDETHKWWWDVNTIRTTEEAKKGVVDRFSKWGVEGE